MTLIMIMALLSRVVIAGLCRAQLLL